MIASSGFPVTKVERSKKNELPVNNIPFGKYFTDYMLEADCENGVWKNIEIKPYQPLVLSPSLAALHYGQAIFEGVKAYKHSDGEAYIFRPRDNFRRFNISAKRMQMQPVTEDIFVEGMRQLIALDKGWIPSKPDHALYIRPFMFATDEMIGVKPSDTYKFMIILSPTGPYYAEPMRIYVEEEYTRAARGGVGFTKVAGNYAASLLPAAAARSKGYDQVLWTDEVEHKYAEEIGTMNVFFVIGDKVVTPDLSRGTILAGVTRDSAITLLRDMGVTVEETRVNLDDVVAAYRAGELKEVFGTGTAATISEIKELHYKDAVMKFDPKTWKIAPSIKKRLDDIREGRTPDPYGWLLKV
ncbi:MAG TPA: branched-chain amino acid aminotransferase [Flavitalea sp.]|nr:branched-chain amino acid aminotransferase [Flavitalea sp.]